MPAFVSNENAVYNVKKVKVALIGTGDISWTYLRNMTKLWGILEVVGCSDAHPERSKARAEEFGIRAMTNEEIFNDPEIQIVVNTSWPSAHYEINKQALEHGKHVYTEKMMGANYEEAQKIVRLAAEKNLRLGCAPDTFLGGAYQTARKLIEDGYIGNPVFAQAFMVRGYRAETAADFERPGGVWAQGSTMPIDMGGYYLHAILNLFGEVKRVAGFSKRCSQMRTNPANPRYGEMCEADAATTMTASLEFASGMLGNFTIVGDSYNEIPRIEVYGTEGELILPDPNTYSGPVMLSRRGSNKFMEIPLTHDYNCYSLQDIEEERKSKEWSGHEAWVESKRGLGVADMAWAIRNNRPHLCSAEMSLHAFEIIHGCEESAAKNIIYHMKTSFKQPSALPAGFYHGSRERALDIVR